MPYAFFHAPGDPELNFEGGLTKIALRSTFTPGSVTVTATAPGLASGTVQLASVAPAAPVLTQAPAIIVPPVDTAVTAGYTATFTVAASGSATLGYQWLLNGNPIGNATATSYTTPVTALAQNGQHFSVKVSNGYGNVTSTPVTLSVVAPAAVAITAQPVAQTAVIGQSATFNVTATGSPALNYAWYENNTLVASGPQASYTTPILTATGTATFYVVVSNPLGPLQSATVLLTINAPTTVSIVTPPLGQIVSANQPVQLAAVIAGSPPYNYQWRFTPSGGAQTVLLTDTQSANTISYTIPAMSAANVGAYTVTVDNAANAPVTSAAAQLTLAPPGVNLALNKKATSSSNQNNCNDANTTPPFTGVGCLGPENAVDGSLATRWGSATAGAPPTPPVSGVDPSWLQVDLGSVQAFNTVIINWENAYAAQYQIQYTSADPATNPTWSVAKNVTTGAGGTETLTFPTVQARYIRMFGTLRGGQYGYSIWEFSAYNVAQCGASNERYTVNAVDPTRVTDNLSGLSWTRTIKTDDAPGAQFTGIDAAAYCGGLNMRLPSKPEALAISGNNDATCAFPGIWSTWTSTVDPNDANETAIVDFDGTTSWNVTNNYPGQTLCDSGAAALQAASIQGQPLPSVVVAGQTATFSVTASGNPAPTYQWYQGSTPIDGATGASYTTPATALSDNGTLFHVVVSNSGATVPSSNVLLTVLPQLIFQSGFEIPTGLSLATQPADQSVTIGTTAQFSVATSAPNPSYQWQKNGAVIPGATAASYLTPAATAPDNGARFSVVVKSGGSSTTSGNATLTVNSMPAYTLYPGYIGTDLNNNTHGAFSDSQVYITVLGNDPASGALSHVGADGSLIACSVADNTAGNALTAPNGHTYPNYAFTLAQSKLLKLPPMSSGRIFVSLGSPLYMSIVAGANGGNNGYAGPNPLNNTDPNLNIHYDWYEFTYGSGGIYINTTQVDEFGLPLTLDVWGASHSFHMQTGITETIAAIDQEFTAETPVAFYPTPISPLRIFSPANLSFNTGQANAGYFDSYVDQIWAAYATTPLVVSLYNGSRKFSGTTTATQFVFSEINQNNGAYVGGTYTIGKPSTQDILYCRNTLATGNSVEGALEAQFCAAFNRHVMDNVAAWAVPTQYYPGAPANYYARFWHNHSIGGLAYGFAYDDVNNQSSTIVAPTPEHMALGVGY